MKNLNIQSFIFILFIGLITIKSTYSSDVYFKDYMPRSTTTNLIKNSPEEDLRWAYSQIRQKSNFDKFVERAGRFEDYILDPIDKSNIQDQTAYIEEARSLKECLANSHPLVISFFDKHIKKLSHRINLAKIDHQFFTGDGHRGDFNHKNIDIGYQNSLNELVGKIFHITQEKGNPVEVSKVGSGIFASRDQDGLQNINKNTTLNSVFTCAHVLEADEDEHILGAYFVPNNFLDPITALPIDLNNPVTTSSDLINYLKKNPGSFQISTYTIRKRDGINVQAFSNNELQVTKPQYWDNEDIVLGVLNTSKNYNLDIVVNFNVTKNKEIPNFKDNELYFALGYPGCPHYSKKAFMGHSQLDLIKDIGFSPLVVTSAKAHNQINPTDKRPLLSDGLVKHEAPTAKGMSGGPLITIKNDQIYFLGCVAGGTTDEKEACY